MNALAIASISLLCIFAAFAVVQLIAYIWFFVNSVQKKKLVYHDTNSRVVKKVPLSTRFIAKFSILCSSILIVNCATLLCQGLLAVPIAESRIVLAVLQTMASVGELMSTLLLIMLSLFLCAKIVKNNVKLGRKSLGDLASIRLGLAIVAGIAILTAAIPCILLVVLLFKYDSGVLQALTNLSMRFFSSIYLSSVIVVLAISMFSGASFGIAINKKPSSTTVALSATAPPVQQSAAESPSVDTLTEQIRNADIPAAEQSPAPLAPLKLQKLNKSNLLLLLQLACLVTLAVLHICLFSVDWRFLDLDYQKSFFVFIFSLDKISLLGMLFTFLVILNPRFNLITFKKYAVDEKGDRIEFRTAPATASQADEKSLSEEPQYPSRELQLSLG